MLEIKFEHKIERAGKPVNKDDPDEEDIDIGDWDYRNFKEGWGPTFKRLRPKLIKFYKEKKFNQHGGDAPKNKLQSMLVREIVEKHCASFLASGFGQEPNASGSDFQQDGRSKQSAGRAAKQVIKRAIIIHCLQVAFNFNLKRNNNIIYMYNSFLFRLEPYMVNIDCIYQYKL